MDPEVLPNSAMLGFSEMRKKGSKGGTTQSFSLVAFARTNLNGGRILADPLSNV